MTKITKQQIDVLQKIMELELESLVDETQQEMDPQLKTSINEIDGVLPMLMMKRLPTLS